MRWQQSQTPTQEKTRKPLILALCSARAGGKTTLASILGEIYGPGFSVLDCSQVCDEHIAMGTPIGEELSDYEERRTSGGLYPDELAVRAIVEKLGWERTRHSRENHSIMYGAILAGIPRKLEQLRLLHGYGYKVQLIHISSTLRQVFEGVRRRELEAAKNKQQMRVDGSIGAVLKSWFNYQVAYPGLIGGLADKDCLTVEKGMSLMDKVSCCLKFANFPMREGVLKAFSSEKHPVRVKIESLQEKVSEPIILRPEVETLLAKQEGGCEVCNSSHPSEPKTIPSFMDVPFMKRDLSSQHERI